MNMKIEMTITIDLQDTFGTSESELLWLENEILVGNGELVLHSNDIGDTVGIVKQIKNIKYT